MSSQLSGNLLKRSQAITIYYPAASKLYVILYIVQYVDVRASPSRKLLGKSHLTNDYFMSKQTEP